MPSELAPITITATQNGTGIVKSVVVNVIPATAAPVADHVAVQTARFQFVGDRGGNIEVALLLVAATSAASRRSSTWDPRGGYT